MHKTFLSILSLLATLGQAESPVDMRPVEVNATPLVPLQRVGQDASVAANLTAVPGVSVVTQGQAAGQTDLSIRGSGFSGAGLSLSGLALRNAQTEHFHAELPIPGTWLGQPEVLSGVQQTLRTEGHLTGTVSFTPLPLQESSYLIAGADHLGGFWLGAEKQQALSATQGWGAYAGGTDMPEVDREGNQVEAQRAAARWQQLDATGQRDVLIGHQSKTFGARGYYGVSDTLPAEESTQDTLLLGSWQSSRPEQTSVSALFRWFEDDYQLWLPTSLFRNQHTTRTAAAQASHRIDLEDRLQLHVRIAGEHEDIESNALGDFQRSRMSLTLLPRLHITESLDLLAGVRAEVLEANSNRVLPQARIEAQVSASVQAYVEMAESIRLPSYTELNYESPGSLGNAGLEVQEQRAWEAGVQWQVNRRSTLETAVFQQETSDTVDWIRTDPAATRWQAENIGDVTTQGAEIAWQFQNSDPLQTRLRYQWLDKDADTPPYASRYFLDYARHLLTAQIDWTISDRLRFEWIQSFREQAPHPLREAGGDQQWNTTLALHTRLLRWPELQWSLMATNALQDDYRPFPGQNTYSPRRVSLAVTRSW